MQKQNDTQRVSLDPAQNWPLNMRPTIAAKYIGSSVSFLAKLRMEQNRYKGPRFSKIAGCIVYRRTDLDAWLEANAVDAA